jgi:hypothetical protein
MFPLRLVLLVVMVPSMFLGQNPPVRQELGATVARAAPVELATEPVTVQIALRPGAGAQIDAAVALSSKTRLVLAIEGIAFVKMPDVHYEVYVDLPKNETPNYKSKYFVGNLAFFSLAHVGGGHTAALNLDITNSVRALKSSKEWDNANLSVTFVMRWLVNRGGQQLPIPPGVRARFSRVALFAALG